MAKVDIGTKRVCPECDAKFYDLTRNPAICPMCQNSFDPAELDQTAVLPNAPLKPQSNTEDDPDEAEDAVEVDEDDIDEDEMAAKELELDGDDAAIISGAAGDGEEKPEFDGFSTDEDEDADAALVPDDDDEPSLPPGADDGDDEEIEI